MKKKLIFLLCFFVITLIVTTNSSALMHYFEIDGTTYATLDNAISSANNGDTINLLSSISLNTPISVSGKAITIDLNGYDMEVNVSKPESILATNGANLTIKDVASSGGALTIHTATGHYAIHANNATIDITGTVNVSTNGSTDPGYGAYANNGGVINFTGDLEGYDACAYADIGSQININGDIDSGFGSRLEAHNGSTIEVNGKVSVELAHPVKASNNSEIIIKDLEYVGDQDIDEIGVWVSSNSTVEIQGVITRYRVSEASHLMQYFLLSLENTTLNFSDYTSLEQKPGYITFSRDGSAVHIKNNWLCNIGRKAFKSLGKAFNAVNDGETINILSSFSSDGSLVLNNKDVTIQTNDFNVDVRGVQESNSVLQLYDSTLTLNGNGEFNLIQYNAYDYITYILLAEKSTAEVSSIYAGPNATFSKGIYAKENSNVTVKNSIDTKTDAIHSSQSIIEVGGDIKSNYGMGMYSINNSSITANGNVEGYNYGVYSIASEVDISGNVSSYSDSGIGIEARNDSEITVEGNIDSEKGVQIYGNDTIVTINGSILSEEFGDIDGSGILESDKSKSGGYEIYQKLSSTATLRVYAPVYNPKLSVLTIQGVILSPSFDPDSFTYTSDVDYRVDQITIDATPSDPSETVKINENTTTSASISLSVGENSINILVIAADNETTNEYIINVTREAKREEKPKVPAPTPSPPEIKVITEKGEEKVDNYVEISPTIINERISSFVTPAIINKLIETALDTKGNESNDFIILKYPSNKSINNQRIVLQRAGLLEITTKTNANLKISTKLIDLIFNKLSLENITDQLNDRNIIFNVTRNSDDISDETKQKYHNRPIYNISIEGSNKSLDKLGETRYNVTFPYMLKDEEHKNAVIIKHIDKNGNETLIDALYNETTKSISASTNLVGTFVIDHVLTSFTDVNESNPYKDAIIYCAARKITNGTGENLFSPKQKLTRAQFIVMLMDAYGIKQLEEFSVDNFTDAGNLYYSSYLHTARALGLVNGVGNNLYMPNKEVSNQESLSMLANILRIKGVNLDSNNDLSQSDILDLSSIAPWARNSVLELVNSKIALNHNGYLKPKTAVTREEFAQIIYNLLTR